MISTRTYGLLFFATLLFAVSAWQASAIVDLTPLCYSDVADMPILCDGNRIIGDATVGECRSISCITNEPTNVSGLTVLACNKPDNGSKTHFEMYRQSVTGDSFVEVCLLGTCLNNKDLRGYAQGGTYPLCTVPAPYCGDEIVNQPSEQCDGSAPPGFACVNCKLVPENATCSNDVREMPVTCAGNDIIHDATVGECRVVICETNASNISRSPSGLMVLACNKPDEGNKTFFEMYRQSTDGSDFIEICFLGTCLNNQDLRGYAKSGTYPICTGPPAPFCGDGVVNQAWEQCDTTAPPGSICTANCTLQPVPPPNASVDLTIAPWFPQGNNYVFVCAPGGFTPTSYSWMFGDGSKLLDVTNSNVWHTFMAPGNYTVACSATNGTVAREDNLTVTVLPIG